MTIFGWDMSHYDAPSIGTAISEGISYVTHKDGGDSPDVEIAAWWAGVKPHRGQILLGAYWILLPGTPVGRADDFLARLDTQCPGWRDGPFILQADCEEWGGNPATVPNRNEIQTFCDRLVDKAPKLRPIVYAPYWVYHETLRGLTYPLWASSYVAGSGGFKDLYPGDSSSRWVAYSGQTPAILQYSSKATIGGQTTSDANAFRGTLTELTNLVAPGWSTDMALTKEDGITVWNSDIIPNPKFRPDAPTNPTTGAAFAVGDVWARVGALQTAVASLSSALTAATASLADLHKEVADARAAQATSANALSALLAHLQGTVDGIQLQQATGGATPDQVEQAVRNVLHGA